MNEGITMKKILALVLMVASNVFAGGAYDYAVRIDTQFPARPLPDLTLIENAQPIMRWDIYQNNQSKTVSTNDSITMYYASTATNGSYVTATNTSVSGNGFYMPLSQSQTATNGTFWYSVLISNSSGVYFSGTGTLTIVKSNIVDGDALELQTVVDYTGVTTYSGVSASGPVRPDFVTVSAVTNADGSITISSMASGVAWGAITGTLSDQTDMQSALDAKVATNSATYTQTVALAASALQSEADTLATVTARGATTTAAVTLGGLIVDEDGGIQFNSNSAIYDVVSNKVVDVNGYTLANSTGTTFSWGFGYLYDPTLDDDVLNWLTREIDHDWTFVAGSTLTIPNGTASGHAINLGQLQSATGGCVQVTGSFAGAMDQGVATTDSPTFNAITVPQITMGASNIVTTTGVYSDSNAWFIVVGNSTTTNVIPFVYTAP